MKSKITPFIFITLLLLSSSCKSKEEKESEMIVTEWIGKKIIFPKNIQFSILGKDTACTDILQKPFKILLYIDSTGCTSCRLRFYDWKSLIEEADSIAPESVSFIFIFQPKKKKELQLLLRQHQLNYPVIVDLTDKINKQNHFPKKRPYQCFLLNKNNTVLMVGDPFINPKIWELYKKLMSIDPIKKTTLSTILQVDSTELNFGHIRINKKSTLCFMLKNTGEKPLVIYSAKTSCGCSHADFDKMPIKPGKTTVISVTMRPDSKGYFYKTIDVYANTNNSPVRLSIKGIAE